MLASPVPTQTMFGFDGAMRDVADRRRDALVEDRRPGHAVVVGLPERRRSPWPRRSCTTCRAASPRPRPSRGR